jgi:hypothetical protein
MGLIDALRRAEEQGKHSALRGLDKARTGWTDAESAIRRKMRIHPRTSSPTAAPVSMAGEHVEPTGYDPASQEEFRREREYEDAERKAIVSVKAEDLSSERTDVPKRNAA